MGSTSQQFSRKKKILLTGRTVEPGSRGKEALWQKHRSQRTTADTLLLSIKTTEKKDKGERGKLGGEKRSWDEDTFRRGGVTQLEVGRERHNGGRGVWGRQKTRVGKGSPYEHKNNREKYGQVSWKRRRPQGRETTTQKGEISWTCGWAKGKERLISRFWGWEKPKGLHCELPCGPSPGKIKRVVGRERSKGKKCELKSPKKVRNRFESLTTSTSRVFPLYGKV